MIAEPTTGTDRHHLQDIITVLERILDISTGAESAEEVLAVVAVQRDELQDLVQGLLREALGLYSPGEVRALARSRASLSNT